MGNARFLGDALGNGGVLKSRYGSQGREKVVSPMAVLARASAGRRYVKIAIVRNM